MLSLFDTETSNVLLVLISFIAAVAAWYQALKKNKDLEQLSNRLATQNEILKKGLGLGQLPNLKLQVHHNKENGKTHAGVENRGGPAFDLYLSSEGYFERTTNGHVKAIHTGEEKWIELPIDKAQFDDLNRIRVELRTSGLENRYMFFDRHGDIWTPTPLMDPLQGWGILDL